MGKVVQETKVSLNHPDMATQRSLPFSEIRDNVIIMKDGSVRVVLQVAPINFNLKSEQEQDSIIISYQRFLNSLKYPVQILVRSLKVDIDGYIHRLKNRAIKQSNSLLQEQTYKYMDFLTNLVDMAQIMKKEFYIVVAYDEEGGERVRNRGIVATVQSFFQSINDGQTLTKIKENRRKLEKMRKEVYDRASAVKTTLEGIGIKSELLSKEDLVKLMIHYYNPALGGESTGSAVIKNTDLL